MLAPDCLRAQSSSHPELQAALSRYCRKHDMATGLTCAGVVVADFNKRFLGRTYHSQLDSNTSVEAMTSAALVAARALHDLASGQVSTEELKASTLFLTAHFTSHLLQQNLCCFIFVLRCGQHQNVGGNCARNMHSC